MEASCLKLNCGKRLPYSAAKAQLKSQSDLSIAPWSTIQKLAAAAGYGTDLLASL